ncbi:hypothetical protein WJX72_009438 [[Myrmecia] bisecta]|uniref:Chorein N-terminal domain-containing protein n=1 Tax=[Myrmecia] bisecta TaxID=41462 RepID=A0AAW1R8U4_9CHLO
MELLLTPIVTRLLRSFIKSAAGEAGSDLRVSLSGGSVLLHNLELNLEPVVKNLPIGVQRAFARQLKVVIPWTSLATQPIQVILDTVEVVVALTEKQQDDKDSSTGSPTAAAADGADTSDLLGSTGGWMGSFTSMLLRTLFNISVTVNNVVVKYLAPTSVATLTCQSIHAYTAADNWEANLQSPEDWLKKVLEIKNTSLCLDERTPDGQVDVFQQPLLRTPCLSVEALVPIFAVLEKTDSVAESTALLNVTVDLLEAATNARQVAWLRTFVTDLPACWAKKLGEPAQAAPTPAAPPVPAGTAAPVPPKPTSSGGSLGAFSRAWGYLTDEAAYVEAALTDGVKAQSIASAPRPKIAAAVSLKGGTWACIDAAMPLRTPSRTASHNQPHTAQPQQQQQQQRQEQQHESLLDQMRIPLVARDQARRPLSCWNGAGCMQMSTSGLSGWRAWTSA